MNFMIILFYPHVIGLQEAQLSMTLLVQNAGKDHFLRNIFGKGQG